MNKKRCLLLVDGYIREANKLINQLIPDSLNGLCFDYTFNPLIWRKNDFHGQYIVFKDEYTINIPTSKRGFCCIDYVIDDRYDDIFSFVVNIYDITLDGIVTIGFFKANDVDEPILKKEELDSEIHTAGGVMSCFWTRFEYTWICIGEHCKSTEGLNSINYSKIGEKLIATKELKIGIKINMKKKTFEVYFNNKYLGTMLKNIPNRIIPAIGLYGDVGDGTKTSCSIHLQEL